MSWETRTSWWELSVGITSDTVIVGFSASFTFEVTINGNGGTDWDIGNFY